MTDSPRPKPDRSHLRLVANPAAGATTRCARCSVPLVVAPTRNAEARMLQHAPTAHGFCVQCSVAQWFAEMGYCDGSMAGIKLDPASLLLPHVQASFVRIMAVSGADAGHGEIDWPKVVRDWALPFPKAPRRARAKKEPGAS